MSNDWLDDLPCEDCGHRRGAHSKPPPVTFVECKHNCGHRIVRRGHSWVHAEGPQIGKNRCAINPYGYNAAPIGEPCDRTCNGYREANS